MIKYLFSGLLVGMANVVPGLSGGTMLVLTNAFEPLTNAVSNVAKRNNKNRKKDILLLLFVIIGVLIGVLAFYSIIDYLNNYIFAQIMTFFMGVILLSSLVFAKNEIKSLKNFKFLWFILGFVLCAALVIFVTPANKEFVIDQNPSPLFLLSLFAVSIIGGATMIFPGISGSLILYVFGMYYAIWGYAKETIKELLSLTFNWYMILPCIVIAIGVIIGIIGGAFVSKALLKKYRFTTLSFILGLIFGGMIKLIPILNNIPEGVSINYNPLTIATCIISFLIGIIVIVIIQILLKKINDRKNKKTWD